MNSICREEQRYYNLEKRSSTLDLTAHHFEDIGMNLIPDLWPHVPQKWAAQCTATACASALPFFRNDTRFAPWNDRNWKMRGKETTTTRGSLKCPSFTHGARTCPHCYNLRYCTAQYFRHTTTSSSLDKLLRKYVDSDSTGSEGYSMPQRGSSINQD